MEWNGRLEGEFGKEGWKWSLERNVGREVAHVIERDSFVFAGTLSETETFLSFVKGTGFGVDPLSDLTVGVSVCWGLHEYVNVSVARCACDFKGLASCR